MQRLSYENGIKFRIIITHKFVTSKNGQNKSINRQIAYMMFSEFKIVEMTINRQIWQLCTQSMFQLICPIWLSIIS